MTTLPGYSETMSEVAKAIWKAEREVGEGKARNECFELHMHPEHLAMIRMTVDSFTAGVVNLEMAVKLLGITIVEDPDVEPGHPVLKCTWQMTL